jgi:hypothetical protein
MYLISWEEGVEGPEGWWLAKDKSLKYKPSRCSPRGLESNELLLLKNQRPSK